MGLLGLPIFHHCTKFGAKMLTYAEIMAKNRNLGWRPIFEKLISEQFYPLGCCTKFGAKILTDAEIMAQYRK